ncbi:aminoacyl-histidine dipeptidase [Clostridium sardiniense]|uniref:aminoacyl-histidine dipeptidase n=1 Tax=Clostridium sardiniense TaxID=29369 RepID=UPI00195AC441|nr:aminoacyl-histidine dipeptidase [Clostridium sardiniense]MBM7836084.1 dipeptidase D [Clostridium sardiniense]
MRVLENLEPKKVFEFFEDLTRIPHDSGNEKEISDYLVKFAKERNLEVIQDKALNVIIKKPATKGYENIPGVIIQGHMDMVCEKLKHSNHDFEKDPLKLRIVDDEFVYATDTTLGADDGIAVAYGLAILDSNVIEHPAIEFVVTTEEETVMGGANELDTSGLKGKVLLNIDAEEEGVFILGCAGGILVYPEIKIEFEDFNGESLQLEVAGLKGGHSGMEIHKQRGNANKLMGRLLYTLGKEVNFNIATINGGSKSNAIPRSCKTIISVRKEEIEKVKEICANLEKDFKNEYKVEDSDIHIIVKSDEKLEKQLTKKVTDSLIKLLFLVPDGIQSMSKEIQGLVESSLNVGIVETLEDRIKFIIDIRSSVRSKTYEIVNRIEALCYAIGATMDKNGEYPEWQYEPKSRIKDLSVKTYNDLFGIEPQITALHAGLESGIFKEKLPSDVEIISFGPDIFDVHTANEHFSIESVGRFYKFLTQLLKNMK